MKPNKMEKKNSYMRRFESKGLLWGLAAILVFHLMPKKCKNHKTPCSALLSFLSPIGRVVSSESEMARSLHDPSSWLCAKDCMYNFQSDTFKMLGKQRLTLSTQNSSNKSCKGINYSLLWDKCTLWFSPQRKFKQRTNEEAVMSYHCVLLWGLTLWLPTFFIWPNILNWFILFMKCIRFKKANL